MWIFHSQGDRWINCFLTAKTCVPYTEVVGVAVFHTDTEVSFYDHKTTVQNRELLYYDWILNGLIQSFWRSRGSVPVPTGGPGWQSTSLRRGLPCVPSNWTGSASRPDAGVCEEFDVWVNQLGLMHEHLKACIPERKSFFSGRVSAP